MLISYNKHLTYILAIFLAIVIFGTSSISYSATLYLLGGLIVGTVLIVIIPHTIKSLFGLTNKWLSGFFIFVVALFALFGILQFLAKPIDLGGAGGIGKCKNPGEVKSQTSVRDYYATIQPDGFSTGLFRVSEEATYLVESITCNADGKTTTSIIEEDKVVSEQFVHSSKRGLMIREIRIIPLKGLLLQRYCCQSKGTVELRDFPRNSFYEARDVQNVIATTYLDTETVKWNGDLTRRDDIVFAYITNPFQLFRNLLSPLIGVSYQSNWVIGLASIIASFIIIPITKPILEDLAKNKLKALIEKKKSSQSEIKKSFLVISSKGEEKEIATLESRPSKQRPSQTVSTIRKASTAFRKSWGNWLAVTILGIILGMAMIGLLISVSSFHNLYFLGAVFGLTLGFGQWLAIRIYISFSSWWILLCALVHGTVMPLTANWDAGWSILILWCIASSIFFGVIRQRKGIS